MAHVKEPCNRNEGNIMRRWKGINDVKMIWLMIVELINDEETLKYNESDKVIMQGNV